MTYSIAYMLGKLLFSYILVWVCCLGIAKFNYKNATRFTHGVKGLVAVFFVFLVPFLGGLAKSYA